MLKASRRPDIHSFTAIVSTTEKIGLIQIGLMLFNFEFIEMSHLRRYGNNKLVN